MSLEPRSPKASTLQPTLRLGAQARWTLLTFAFPLIGGIVTFGAHDRFLQLDPQRIAEATADTTQAAENVAPTVEPALPVGESMDVRVARNDTMEKIFRRSGIRLADLAAIRALPDSRRHLDDLRPGDQVRLRHLEGELHALERRLDETTMLSIDRQPTGFALALVPTPIEFRTALAAGTIESSLFVGARNAGLSPELILRLANDVFGWDIDFALDIRRGDGFRLLYARKFRDGEYLGDGPILAAEFTNDGRIHRAVYFASDDGKISDYFSPDGRSMRKQFLRAPIDFNRISSGFTTRRLHPLLNINRAHQGVDYVAPIGTPVKAAGDGRIAFVGIKGGYGRAIILEHGGGISTLYGHLSRFAPNMRPGTRVAQSQLIGHVGNSGTATGPHLHYEYRLNGIHKNPRTVVLPDAQPIPAAYAAEFAVASRELFAQLDGAQAAYMAQVSVAH